MVQIVKLILVLSITLAINLQAQKLPKGATKEIKNGVEIINNIDTPLYPNKKIKLVEDLSLGGEVKNGEDPKGEILNLTDLYIGTDQKIYAVENRQTVKVFDENGKFISNFVRKGGGPGEVRHVLDLSILKDGRILILDMMGRKANYFDKNYKFQKSYLFVPVGTYSFNANYSFVDTTYVKEIESKGKIELKRLSFSGKELSTLQSFEVKVIPENEAHFPGEYIIVAEDKINERFYVAPTNDYHIKVYDKNWKLIKIINKPYEKVEVTKKDKEQFIDMTNSANKGGREYGMTEKTPFINRFYKAIYGMYVDDSGNLWISSNHNKLEGDKKYTLYNLINKDGVFEANLWLRDDVWIRSIKKNKIYTFYYDKESSERYIKRYKFSIE